jgi:hypothetical protein
MLEIIGVKIVLTRGTPFAWGTVMLKARFILRQKSDRYRQPVCSKALS